MNERRTSSSLVAMALPILYVQKTLADLVLEVEETLHDKKETQRKVQLALEQVRNEVRCRDKSKNET